MWVAPACATIAAWGSEKQVVQNVSNAFLGQRPKGFQSVLGARDFDDDLIRHAGEDVRNVQ